MTQIVSDVDAYSDPTSQRIVSKILWRILPILMLGYFVAFIDRVNVGFAATEMNKDLGFTAAVYGIGSGIFFVGYFLFEVPSNLALHRFGARLWIARIMITWGVISGAMALVNGQWSFYLVRFLLGVAEAGFFPGIVFYLTLWLPAKERAKVLGIFYLAIPFAVVFGAMVSSPLLLLDGTLGLRGWQWLFVVEAIPAVLLGLFILGYLDNEPRHATWLDTEEKRWLQAEIAKDKMEVVSTEKHGIGAVLMNRQVLKFSAIYFCMNFAGVGLVMFLPLIVSGFGVSHLWAGVVTAIPYAAAAVVLPLWGRYSDKHQQSRTLHSAASAFLVAAGLATALLTGNPAFMLVSISGAAIGIYAFAPPFWALTSTFFTGAASATAIAAINSVGNLSGFVSPFVMGWLKDSTGSFEMSLLAIALGPAIAGLWLALTRRRA